MEQFTIHRDDEPDLSFTGELLASASSSADTAHPDYSGTTGRWTELELYRTQGGTYICARIERTQWQGEHDVHSAAVADDPAGVIQFFGYSRLAMALYEEAQIDASEAVE